MPVRSRALKSLTPDRNQLARLTRTQSLFWDLPPSTPAAIAASQALSAGMNLLLNGTGVFQDANNKNAVLPIPAQLAATCNNLDNTFTALVTGKNHLGEPRTVTWTATSGNVLKMETSGVIWSEIFDITFSAAAGTGVAASIGYDYPAGNTFRAPLPFRLNTRTFALPGSDLLGVVLMDKGGATVTLGLGAKFTILTTTALQTDDFCSFGATPVVTPPGPTAPMRLCYIFKDTTIEVL